MWRAWVGFILTATFASPVALAAEEVAAVISIGGTDYFIVRETGVNSGWLKVGDVCKGRTLARYDRQSETLELKAGASTTTLHLASSHVQPGVSTGVPGVPFELVTGHALVLNGKILYSRDAVLKQGNQVLRAANGQMSSDASKPALVHGDITVLDPHGIFTAKDATFDANARRITSRTITLESVGSHPPTQ